jgi:predicted DsbA family dithiol-disulfide isomerase
MSRKLITIDVVSDTVCPWCYVGKRRLEKAIKQFKDQVDFSVKWLPYQLNPSAPAEGVNKLQSYNDKFGPGRVAQMIPAMTATFADEGLTYSIGGLTGNTRNSHRLLAWAAQHHGLKEQNQLAEELFNGYFCQEQYINDRSFLLRCVEAVGLPVQSAQAILDDATGGEAEQLVLQEIGRHPGVTGVPHFVVDGRVHISGAQDPDVFARHFKKLLLEQAS